MDRITWPTRKCFGRIWPWVVFRADIQIRDLQNMSQTQCQPLNRNIWFSLTFEIKHTRIHLTWQMYKSSYLPFITNFGGSRRPVIRVEGFRHFLLVPAVTCYIGKLTPKYTTLSPNRRSQLASPPVSQNIKSVVTKTSWGRHVYLYFPSKT
jgi:hypothetical protein